MHEVTKYLKESCRLCSEQHFSFKYCHRDIITIIVKAFFGATGMNRLTDPLLTDLIHRRCLDL